MQTMVVRASDRLLLGVVWIMFVVVALLLLDLLPGVAYGIVVPSGALFLAASTATIPACAA